MSVSTMTTVWCDGLTDDGTQHAEKCPQWSGEGLNAREARRRSDFVNRGRHDYSRACLAARAAEEKAEVGE